MAIWAEQSIALNPTLNMQAIDPEYFKLSSLSFSALFNQH
jgi:hypothetical protein